MYYLLTHSLLEGFLSTSVGGGFFFFFFLQYCGLNSGPTPEPFHQPFFVMGFFQGKSLKNYLAGLASNHDPPDHCLLSS
jgi:hypothetical protein